MPLVVSGRQVRWVRETAEVRQVRWETWGWLERLQWAAATAAVESPSPWTSEIRRDSAASLRSGEVKQGITLCTAHQRQLLQTAWLFSPGRNDRGERPAPLASKFCSRCLNTSLGLKDLWEIRDLASWERWRQTEVSEERQTHKRWEKFSRSRGSCCSLAGWAQDETCT